MGEIGVGSNPVGLYIYIYKAHGGDFGLFAKLDVDNSGDITEDEWVDFLHKTVGLHTPR